MNLQENIQRIKEVMGLVNESIDPSEAYTDEGALKTVIERKRNIASIIELDLKTKFLIKFNGLKIKKHKADGHVTYFVYRPGSEEELDELISIADKYGGYLAKGASKEDTIRIGQLLGYNQDKIDEFVRKHYEV